MPIVGDEEFAYTPEGEAAAEDFAEATGQDVIRSYDAGGRVERIQGYAYGGIVDKPINPSNLVENEEMVQGEVDKFLKPQIMAKGGKVTKVKKQGKDPKLAPMGKK